LIEQINLDPSFNGAGHINQVANGQSSGSGVMATRGLWDFFSVKGGNEKYEQMRKQRQLGDELLLEMGGSVMYPYQEVAKQQTVALAQTLPVSSQIIDVVTIVDKETTPGEKAAAAASLMLDFVALLAGPSARLAKYDEVFNTSNQISRTTKSASKSVQVVETSAQLSGRNARNTGAYAANMNSHGHSGPVKGPWTSKDPLVGDVANSIEAAYPGHVKGVNVKVLRPGTIDEITDIDILTNNAAIQVKSGPGKKLENQVIVKSPEALEVLGQGDLPVIGYGPDLSGSVIKGIQNLGGLVTRSLKDLLEVIRP